MSRFLVIGSNSFSGASFIKHLLENEHDVVGVSRSEELNKVYLPYTWDESIIQNFKFEQIDWQIQVLNTLNTMITEKHLD